jgi:hypothetical protein
MTLSEGSALPFFEIMPPAMVQLLPALSTSLLADGIMLPLAEVADALTELPELLEPEPPEIGVVTPAVQAGIPAAAGGALASQAPPVQLHQPHWLFSW